MTEFLPPPSAKLVAPHGGMDQVWYEKLRAAIGSVNGSAENIAKLGTAAKEDICTEDDVRAYENSKKVVTTAAIRAASAFVDLAFASNVEIDWEAGAMRSLHMTGDAVLGNPSNAVPGTFMTIYVIGSDSSERELTFGSAYGGVHPELLDITSTKAYVVSILCITASHFVVTGIDGSPP